MIYGKNVLSFSASKLGPGNAPSMHESHQKWLMGQVPNIYILWVFLQMKEVQEWTPDFLPALALQFEQQVPWESSCCFLALEIFDLEGAIDEMLGYWKRKSSRLGFCG